MVKIIRLPQVKEKTSISRSSIYSFIKDGSFPKPINLSERSVGWIEEEIDNWINERVNRRNLS